MKAVFYLLGSIVLILIILALTGVINTSGLFPQSKVEVVNQQPYRWYNSFYDPIRRGRRWWDRDVVVIGGGGRCRGGSCRGRRGPRGPAGPAGPPGPAGPSGSDGESDSESSGPTIIPGPPIIPEPPIVEPPMPGPSPPMPEPPMPEPPMPEPPMPGPPEIPESPMPESGPEGFANMKRSSGYSGLAACASTTFNSSRNCLQCYEY